MKTKINVNHAVTIEIKPIPGYDLVLIGSDYYIGSSVPEGRAFSDAARKILGDTDVRICMPKKLKIKIPKGKKLYEQKCAHPSEIPYAIIQDFRDNGASYEFAGEEKALKENLDVRIGIDWRSMDGTMWEYNESSGFFEPIPCIKRIELSNFMEESVDRKKLQELVLQEIACISAKWEQKHCSDCGGNTLIIRWQETEEEAGTKTARQLYSSPGNTFVDKLFPEALKK